MTPTSTRAAVTAVAALVAGAAPYVGPGPELNAPAVVELVDHVVPAVATLVVASIAVVRGRFGLVAAVVTFLSGVWMVGTHVPLLLQVPDQQARLGVALVHTVPGIALLGIGIVALRTWSAPTAATERAEACGDGS